MGKGEPLRRLWAGRVRGHSSGSTHGRNHAGPGFAWVRSWLAVPPLTSNQSMEPWTPLLCWRSASSF